MRFYPGVRWLNFVAEHRLLLPDFTETNGRKLAILKDDLSGNFPDQGNFFRDEQRALVAEKMSKPLIYQGC